MDKVSTQIMAFDFGKERIGVAIGNTTLKISHPIGIVTGKNKFEKFDQIASLIEKWCPQMLLVGLPSYSIDKDDLLKSIKKFTNRLKHRFKLPVEFVDEDYSSALASQQLNEQNIRGHAQKCKLDQLAACAILATYFGSLDL